MEARDEAWRAQLLEEKHCAMQVCKRSCGNTELQKDDNIGR